MKNNNKFLNNNDQHFAWGWNENGQLGINGIIRPKYQYYYYHYETNQVIDRCVKKPTPLNAPPEFYSKSVSIGLTHSLLIDSKGRLYSSGKGQYGRLGLGDESTMYSFHHVDFGNDGNNEEITELNKHRYTSNYYQSRVINRPINNGGYNIKKVIKISCGGAHSAFITESFELYTFGRNDRGQLGHGLIDQLLVPKKVKYQQYEYDEKQSKIRERTTVSIDNVDQVACGLNHTVFSLNDGCVYSMGDNKHFQLGFISTNEEEQMEYRPKLIESINLPLKPLELRYTNIKSISCGSNFSCCIKQGNIYTWGINTLGQCGHSPNETKSIASPKLLIIYNDASTLSKPNQNDDNDDQEIEELKIDKKNQKKKKTTFNFIQVSSGNDHSLALTSNGEVFAWGDSKQGQIGLLSSSLSTYLDEIDTSTPIKVKESLSNEFIIQIAAGAYHSMALSRSNNIYCWGLNDYYQVGEETESIGHQKIIHTPHLLRKPKQQTPNKQKENIPILQISAGGRSSMAIRRFLLSIELRPSTFHEDIKRIYKESSFSDLKIIIKNTSSGGKNLEFKLHKLFLQRSKNLLEIFKDVYGTDNNCYPDVLEFDVRQLLALKKIKQGFIIKNEIQDLYENEPHYSIEDDENGKEQIIRNLDTDLSQHLFSMVNQQLFSDITIKIEYFDPSLQKQLPTVIFHAHKCILVNRSEKFKTLLESSYFKESIDNIITINNFSPETYEIYLKYLYTDILNINNENAIELFILSHQESQFRMKDLIEEYLSNSLECDNVPLIFELALQLNDNNVSLAKDNNSFLIDRCIYFMAQNLEQVQKTDTFLSLSEDSKKILLSNSINIKEEILKSNQNNQNNQNNQSNDDNDEMDIKEIKNQGKNKCIIC